MINTSDKEHSQYHPSLLLIQLNSSGFRNGIRWLYLSLLRHSLLRGGVRVQKRYGTVLCCTVLYCTPIKCVEYQRWIVEVMQLDTVFHRTHTVCTTPSSPTPHRTYCCLVSSTSLYPLSSTLLSSPLDFLFSLSFPCCRFSVVSRQFHSHDQVDCFLLVMTTITAWVGMYSERQTSTTINCKVRGDNGVLQRIQPH